MNRFESTMIGIACEHTAEEQEMFIRIFTEQGRKTDYLLDRTVIFISSDIFSDKYPYVRHWYLRTSSGYVRPNVVAHSRNNRVHVSCGVHRITVYKGYESFFMYCPDCSKKMDIVGGPLYE